MKTISPKNWLLAFICLCAAAFAVMTAIVYFVDPYCYYRIPDDWFIVNNYRFLNAGIIKNAEYDTVMIGSSMTHNFKMASFRSKLKQYPVKLTVGGMSLQGMELIYSRVLAEGKAAHAYFCVDLPALNKDTDALETYATYLFNDTITDDYKYWLGYETWMRLLPLNIGFNLLDSAGANIPAFYGTRSIDTIAEGDSDAVPDGQKIISDYILGMNQISKQNTLGISERMKANADSLFDIIFQDPDVEITIFFPPYSALMWYQAQQEGYLEEYQMIKKYIVTRASEHENTTIYDFQCMPIITDLDNYKDISHYSGEINEMMVDCFASGQYIVTSESIEESIDMLYLLVAEFKLNNQDWLA